MGVDTNYAASATAANLTASWRDEAACKGLGSLMDPPRNHTDPATVREALDVCRFRCEAIAECQAWVMALPERQDPGGVCGGLTEDQRARARRVAGGHKSAATIAAKATVDDKECRKCGVVKDHTEFYGNKGHKDGLGSHCIVCHRASATATRLRKKAGVR